MTTVVLPPSSRAGMQVRLLGPVDVLADGVARPVRGLRRTGLLAVLALSSGEIVSTDRLLDAVWGERPPAAAANAVQTQVSHLRAALGGRAAIRFHAPGYLLDLGAAGTDVQVAERLIHDGTHAADDIDRARQLRAAIELWRGQPLANLADLAGRAWLDEQVGRLCKLRLEATRALVETRLALGEHAALLPELERLAVEHPFDEQVHRHLVLALYRAGRQADALGAYHRLRQTLGTELGIDPGRALRDLQAAVLRQDPGLDLAPPAVTLREGERALPAAAPAQLPAAVSAFVGRGGELAALDAILDAMPVEVGRAPTAVVISAVAGTAGVGKTALAVQWAHRAADRFPDGQLYVNLRGYDPQAPMTAADALAGFLGALGVPGADVPLGLDDRAARYRTEVAGRRLLVVLDNAGSVEQVRPLLPGTPTAMMLVTSRDSLAGLVALHGARRLDLDLLPSADAVALLRDLVGRRVDADPDAAAALAEQCARLPLALRVAAELAAARPGTPLADLVTELADQQRRLDLLDAGSDPRAAMRPVFSWSYRHLPDTAARTFRLLGLHPGADLDAHAAAALAGTDPDQARRTLDQLARAHLVHHTGTGRYGMHDLLRAYAASLTSTEDAAGDRSAALGRLFDYYLATAAAAIDVLHPAEAHRRPRIPPPATPTPAIADPAAALAWLDGERPTLVAVAAHTAANGWPAHTVALSTTLYRYLARGHYTDALTIHGHARRAAEQAADPAGQAQALTGLSHAHLRLGRPAQATEQNRQALALFQQAGDLTGQARVVGNLGIAETRLGRYAAAADHQRQAYALFEQVGDLTGQANSLRNLANVEERQGRYETAADRQRQALALFRQAGDHAGEAGALTNLGDIEAHLGRYGPAARHQRQALALFRQNDNQHGEAWAHTGLGDAHVHLGQLTQAADHYQQALALFRDTGDRDGEPWALNGLGDAAHTAGNPADALARHTDALAAATDACGRDQQARAHAGLGRAHCALGHPIDARRHLRHALDLYADLGSPEVDTIRAQLATLDHHPDGERSP